MTQGPAHLLLVPGLWWLFSSASCTFTRLLLPWGKEVFAGPAPPQPSILSWKSGVSELRKAESQHLLSRCHHSGEDGDTRLSLWGGFPLPAGLRVALHCDGGGLGALYRVLLPELTGRLKTELHRQSSPPAPPLHPYFSENLAPEDDRVGLGSGLWCVIFTAFSYHICIFKNSSAE